MLYQLEESPAGHIGAVAAVGIAAGLAFVALGVAACTSPAAYGAARTGSAAYSAAAGCYVAAEPLRYYQHEAEACLDASAGSEGRRQHAPTDIGEVSSCCPLLQAGKPECADGVFQCR